jgi:hypothetical protein
MDAENRVKEVVEDIEVREETDLWITCASS